MDDNFDLEAYFAKKLGNPTDVSKESLITKAMQDKLAQLEAYRSAVAAQAPAMLAEEEARKKSWVGQLGLDNEGLVGRAVNLGANLVDGAITVEKNIGTSIHTLRAAAIDSNIPDAVKEARARQLEGKATAKDLELLALPAGDTDAGRKLSPYQKVAREQAIKDGSLETNAQRIARMEGALRDAAAVREGMDSSSIVQRDKQNALQQQLHDSFTANADQVVQGWDEFKQGQTHTGVPKMVAGLGSMLANIGKAAVDNPQASAEFIANNIPQIVAAASGQGGMALTNITYAVDEFGKGIEEYQKQHNGALPPQEWMREKGALAASLALAEYAGDNIILGAGKMLPKSAAKAATTEAEAATKTFKDRLLNNGVTRTAGAGLEGGTGEFATEAYQTWGENTIEGKSTTAADAYVGGAIGAIVGSGMSGGMHAPTELSRETPEQRQVRLEAKAARDAQKQAATGAIASGDVSTLADPKSPSYAPDLAVTALLGHSQVETVTPEAKAASLEQATQIVDTAQARRDDIAAVLESQSPAAKAAQQQKLEQAHAQLQALQQETQADPQQVAQLKERVSLLEEMAAEPPMSAAAVQRMQNQLNTLDAQLDKARTALTTFHAEQSKTVDVGQQADAAGAATPQSAQAADTVINLSMTTPERLDPTKASELANNPNAPLTDAQRAYLRAFPEARAAENALKTMGRVSNEVLFGSPPGSKQKYVGIQQYRTKITQAIMAGNQQQAAKQLDGLKAFAADHTNKAAIAEQAWQKGRGTQIVSQGNGQWAIADRHYSDKEINANGGLTLNTPSLVTNIRTEADALTKAVTEMEAAMDVKFGATTQPTTATTATTTTSTMGTGGAHVQNQAQPQEVRSNDAPAVTQAPAPQAAVADQNAGSAAATSEEAAAGVAETANDAPVIDETVTGEPETAAPTSGQLDVFAQRSTEDRPFNQRNLVADYFMQAAEQPLAKVKDFLASLTLPEGSTGKQQKAVSLLKTLAAKWDATIKANLHQGVEAFRYKDMTQFLLQDGKLDLEANVKTAMTYAAFSWIAENANRSSFNTDEEINQILGRDEDTLLTKQEEQLRHVGTRQNVVANALGQRVVQALGLKALKTAPLNLQADLEATLGAHVMKLLLDQGILQRTTLSGKAMAALTGSANTSVNAEFQFISLARENGQLHADAQAIAEGVKGTQGIIDKVFHVESGLKEPTTEPVKFVQKLVKNARALVPSKLAEILQKKNAEKNFVRQDMWQLITQLSDTTLHKLAGAVDIDHTVHGINRLGLMAKNDALAREISNFRDYVGNFLQNTREGLDTPIHFEHTVWKQQRVGIATNLINPQTSKVHRHLITKEGWTTEIDANDAAQMDNFLLRVAEGLGVKTDKQGKDAALAQLQSKLADPVIAQGIKVLQQTIFDGGISSQQQEILVQAVQAGGENFHSLDALVALATYEQAKKEGKTTFATQLMGEVDGVTNGPMLTHLLLGAANSAKELFGLLNKGGFFEVGNAHDQYNLWRAAANHFDLYETTAAHMDQALQQMIAATPNLSGILSTVYKFTGQLADNGKVLKAGRDIVKTPLTAMVFGSAVPNAIDSMADKFIESVYARIEQVAQGKANLKEVVSDINALLVMGKGASLPANITLEQLMAAEVFHDKQIDAIKRTFKNTLGKAVEQTMRQDFEKFIEQRKAINETAQATFALYRSLYLGLREQFIADQIAAGKMAVDGKGKPIHDLTAEQEAQLRAQIKSVAPMLHTLLSKDSGQLAAGLYMAKTGRKLSEQAPFINEVQFGQKFGDNGAKSTKVRAYESTEVDPGVAMLVMDVHATDSVISHYAADGHPVLNIHDAHGAGVGNFADAAQNLNKATWDAMLRYSPATEMANALGRTVTGLAQLVGEGKLPAAALAHLNATLTQYAKEMDVQPEQVLQTLLTTARTTAFNADSVKLDALAQMQAIDQYALEGGNYTVTDANRKEAETLRNGLQQGLTAAEQQAVTALQNALQVQATEGIDPVTTPVAEIDTQPKQWDAVGPAAIESNDALVNFFALEPTPSVGRLLQVLKYQLDRQPDSRQRDFQLKLLSILHKTVNPKLAIQYVTPGMEGVTAPTQPSRGWFVSQGAQETLHVLSPAFVHSGVTTELLIHELVHSALARTIDTELAALAKNSAYRSDALALVQELQALQAKAAEFVQQNKLSQHAAAVTNVQELVAWGLSNQAFQREVLNQIQLQSQTSSNKLVSGMRRFIEAITGILFRGSAKSAQQQAVNGMSVLLANTSGLFYHAGQTLQAQQSAQSTAQTGPVSDAVNLSMATQAILHDYTTLDLHEALADPANPLTPAFDTHLRSLLGGIVEALHGAYGSFTSTLMKNQPLDPISVWAHALQTGKAPFASKVLANLQTSRQEAFAIEQVEATVRAAITGNEAFTKMAYQELAKLFVEARDIIKPSDLNPGEWDFIFNVQPGQGGKSDYLARFAAIGLGHAKINSLLQVATRASTVSRPATFAERLQGWFEKVLEFFQQKLTHTHPGQRADEKLQALVEQLVAIEAKRRITAARMNQGLPLIEPLEKAIKAGTDATRDKVAQLLGSPAVRQHSSALVRGIGGLARTVANRQVDWFMKGLLTLRDQQLKAQHGIAASIVSEIWGTMEQKLQELLREAKNHERIRKHVITTTAKTALELFANSGKSLTKEGRNALSAVLLRTGAHALIDHLSLPEIQAVLENETVRKQTIAALEQQLDAFGMNFKQYFINQAKALGDHRATGKSRGVLIMQNAGNIARMYGTPYANRLTDAQTEQATTVIQQLIPLYAFNYVDREQLITAQQIVRAENARTDGNGIAFLLGLHAQLEQQAHQTLFQGQDALMQHGYVPEILDPYIEVRAVDAVEGAELKKQGWEEGEMVSKDSADPDRTAKRLYVLKDGGMMPHLTGIISYTGKQAKGSKIHNGFLNVNTISGLANAQTQADILHSKHQQILDLFTQDIDPATVQETHMVPVVNPQGEVVNFRYMMSEANKDKLLNRTNQFDKVIGALAGSVYDKQTATEQNKKAVQALRDQYQQEYATNPDVYRFVGAGSTDPQLREIWDMLPRDTKQMVRAVWGQDGMWVRNDTMDVMFGYRKLSAASLLDKSPQDREHLEQLFGFIAESIFGDKAKLRVRQIERGWQEVVREVKDIVVVRSGVVLAGNIWSNLSQLVLRGVPMKDIVHHHIVALKGATAYHDDIAELDRLKLLRDTGYPHANLAADIARLEDAIARNPVKKLVDAGLMPTIVEDIDPEDDLYTYKSKFTRTVQEHTAGVNPHVMNAVRMAYMAKEFNIYQGLSRITQLSDFVARYTLYQHLINQKENPLTEAEAIQEASDAFVNYDIPMHRTLQYSDDMGFTMFTKYFLRIQRVLVKTLRDNPARVLTMLALNKWIGLGPIVLDSSMIHHAGFNPFHTGAFQYVGALKDLASVHAAMALVK